MKKAVYSLLLVAMSTAVFVSCKKDYTCKCSITVSLLGQTSTADSTYTIAKSSKKDAKANCSSTSNSLNTTVQIVGGNASCSLD